MKCTSWSVKRKKLHPKRMRNHRANTKNAVPRRSLRKKKKILISFPVTTVVLPHFQGVMATIELLLTYWFRPSACWLSITCLTPSSHLGGERSLLLLSGMFLATTKHFQLSSSLQKSNWRFINTKCDSAISLLNNGSDTLRIERITLCMLFWLI